MPKEFSYAIKQGKQVFDDPAARQRFLASKPDEYRGFESHHKPTQSKSNLQLGYYWGLLVPEVRKRLKEMGWTISVGKGEHAFERYYTSRDTHDWLKEYCARVGHEGVFITLSEQDQELCSIYIDHVLWVAEHWLNMDRQALEARKPKLRKENG